MHEGEITKFLQDWQEGDPEALERLLPHVYDELKHQASYLMQSERRGHTLQPTALVHEAFIKISKLPDIKWKNRTHFYRMVSRLMRQILVEHARGLATSKRGKNPVRIPFDDVQLPVENKLLLVLTVDGLLGQLADLDERQAQIVEMRFFGGLMVDEIAEVMNVSKRTVLREWKHAKLWLLSQFEAGAE